MQRAKCAFRCRGPKSGVRAQRVFLTGFGFEPTRKLPGCEWNTLCAWGWLRLQWVNTVTEVEFGQVETAFFFRCPSTRT